jgi:hypothetical protein
MSTTNTFSDVAEKAAEYIFGQICAKQSSPDPVGETIIQVLDRIQKKDVTLTERILVLLELEQFREHMNGPQEDGVRILLAQTISRCKASLHTDLVEYITLTSLSRAPLAMCWIMRGKWCQEADKEALRAQWRYLDSLKLSRFFKRPRKKLRLKRKKERILFRRDRVKQADTAA